MSEIEELVQALEATLREAVGWYDESRVYDPKDPPEFVLPTLAVINKYKPLTAKEL